MKNKELNNLQNPENWDYDKAEKRVAVKAARVVVSVAFSREGYERVAEYAELFGKRISAFIREAALDKTTSKGASVTVFLTGASLRSSLFTREQFAPTTFKLTSATPLDEPVASTT